MCGEALLRKTVSVDYLTKKCVKNINIADKYYVSNDHEGIISKEILDTVQSVINSSTKKGKR